jgi:hypothetical protein
MLLISLINKKMSQHKPELLCSRWKGWGISWFYVREVLLRGKTQYSWPPCTNYFRSALFTLKILFSFFTQQATLMRKEVKLYCPPLLVFTGYVHGPGRVLEKQL